MKKQEQAVRIRKFGVNVVDWVRAEVLEEQAGLLLGLAGDTKGAPSQSNLRHHRYAYAENRVMRCC